MKLTRAHAKNYRNIIDSNVVNIGQTTCLVGKNEAGKTAFLKALEGLMSTNPSFREYNKIEHYPRRLLSDYDSDHNGEEATVIDTTWEISEEEILEVEKVFGKGIINSTTVQIQKKYATTQQHGV